MNRNERIKSEIEKMKTDEMKFKQNLLHTRVRTINFDDRHKKGGKQPNTYKLVKVI